MGNIPRISFLRFFVLQIEKKHQGGLRQKHRIPTSRPGLRRNPVSFFLSETSLTTFFQGVINSEVVPAPSSSSSSSRAAAAAASAAATRREPARSSDPTSSDPSSEPRSSDPTSSDPTSSDPATSSGDPTIFLIKQPR